MFGFLGKALEQSGARPILFDQGKRPVAGGTYAVDRWHFPSPVSGRT
jgi:hypothetical protein